MSLSQRLVAGSLAVLGAFVLLTFVSLDRGLRGELRNEIHRDLVHEAQLVGLQWTTATDADSLADLAGATLGRRVTLIGPDGRVLGDSELDGAALVALGNEAQRPEVVEARRVGAGSALRPNPSGSGEEQVVAARVPLGVVRIAVSADAPPILVRRLQRDLLVVGLAGGFLAVLLAAVFARSVVRPLLELRDDARALAAGDLARRPSLSARGEVGELAAAFYRLAEQLGARLAALEADDARLRALTESLNEGTVAIDAQRQVVHLNEHARRLLGVSDEPPFPADRLPRDRLLRDAIDGALAGLVSERLEIPLLGRTVSLTARPLPDGGAVIALFDLTPLRRLETVRRDFVANVSHELKTPLTVVGGFAETLTDESLDAEARRRFALAIVANTRRMQRLVDDLLDLSRIESGGWTPAPALVDFRQTAAEALSPVAAAAAAKGVALRVECDAGAASFRADPVAVRQILANLVENAVRHTAAGEVVVFAATRPDGVVFGVRDTGPGIAPEHLGRIFERFYRVDTSRSREEGGTGLGLAIVKHLVEAHGGQVRAESTPGRGTMVEAFLPSS